MSAGGGRGSGRAVAEFGRLDGLYHVAGGSGRSQGDGPLHLCTDTGWKYTQQLNLDSLFFANRAAVQQFLRQGQGGSVLNMTSVLGFAPAPRHFGTLAYATTKAAAIGLTVAAAAYYAPQNIRFNALAPHSSKRRSPNGPRVIPRSVSISAPNNRSMAVASASPPTSMKPLSTFSPRPRGSSPVKCWPSTGAGV